MIELNRTLYKLQTVSRVKLKTKLVGTLKVKVTDPVHHGEVGSDAFYSLFIHIL